MYIRTGKDGIMTMAYYPKPQDGKNAAQRYKEKCDAITIRPRLEDGEFIRSAAEYHGLSVTKYILTACKAYDKDNTITETTQSDETT